MDLFASARRQMIAGQLNDNRERLMRSFEGLSQEEMQEPGVCGVWSVRDVLAHIAAWDRATTGTFRRMLEGEHPPFLDTDEDENDAFNAEQHEASLNMTVDEVVTEVVAAREEMVELLRGVDNPTLFAPAPGDEHADLSIAACVEVCASHDEEHAEMIEQWRDGRGA